MEQRDFIGYGKDVPKVEWPHGARIAVNIVLNYEVGAEFNPLDGDPYREPAGETYPLPPDERHMHQESIYEYGSRAGCGAYCASWKSTRSRGPSLPVAGPWSGTPR